MKQLKLYMLLIGAKPPDRHTEQHDILFCIGYSIREVLPQVKAFWPEAKKTLHLDAWREVTLVNGYNVSVTEQPSLSNAVQLFFINLGGYKQGEFEEFHYKLIVAAADKADAIRQARQTAFFKHTGFSGAQAHIDDKYGIDVDDIFAIPDILPAETKKRFQVNIQPADKDQPADTLHLGYFKPELVDKWEPK